MRYLKKYKNRRLYCLRDHRYVCNADVTEFIQAGDTVTVNDMQHRDVTADIYSQILSDYAKAGMVSAEALLPLIKGAIAKAETAIRNTEPRPRRAIRGAA